METVELLEKTQDKLRNALLEEMEEGIDNLLSAIDTDSAHKAAIYQYKGQYNEIVQNSNQGVLKYETKILYSNRIRVGLLEIIDKLTLNDFSIENDVFSNEEKQLIQNSVKGKDDTPKVPVESTTPAKQPQTPTTLLANSAPLKKVVIGASFIGLLLFTYFIVIPMFTVRKAKTATRTTSTATELSGGSTLRERLVIDKNTFSINDLKKYQVKNVDLIAFYPKITSLFKDLLAKKIEDRNVMINLVQNVEKYKPQLEAYKAKFIKVNQTLLQLSTAQRNKYRDRLKRHYDFKTSMDGNSIGRISYNVNQLDQLYDKILAEPNQ